MCQRLLLLLLLGTSVTQAHAVTRSEAVQRARDWVNAGLPYCQCPNFQWDSHGYCGGRASDPAWDPYRSDCSGLVSWAWGLPPPGRVTWTLAPYNNDVSSEIALADLRPGDALNTNEGGNEHVALFVEWAGTNVVHVIEESGWGTVAHDSWWNVTPVGNTLVSWAIWHPIRGHTVTEDCAAHCEGSEVVASDCSRGDCAVYGSNCVQDILGARCVFFACPALGVADACLPDGKTIVHCENGVPTSSGDCSLYAAYCSTQGSGVAHCTSIFCAAPSSKPVVHDTCGLQKDLLHCDATGIFQQELCPAGMTCSDFPSPHCTADAGCPDTGDTWTCRDGRALHCFNGSALKVFDCPASGQVCAVDGGTAQCVGGYAGNPTDAGVAPLDGGSGTAADGGSGSPVDAGAPADGGSAGQPADAGPVVVPGPAEPRGCSASGSDPGWAALGLTAAWTRRRRSR